MKKAARSLGLFAILVLAAGVLFAGTGCISAKAWRGITETSAGTVAATVLDLTVIEALECTLADECLE